MIQDRLVALKGLNDVQQIVRCLSLIGRMLALCIIFGGSLPAKAKDVPKILASIKPIQMILSAIAGDELDVELLLDPSFSPHLYHLKPSDVGKITESDMLFWVGPSLETFLSQVIVSTKPKKVVTLMQHVSLTSRLASTQHDHGDHHGHEHSGPDTHIWLAPEFAIAIAEIATEEFADLAPTHRERFHERLATFKAKVLEADRDNQILLAPVRTRGFVVTHDGYGYFVSHYGLKQVAALAISPDRQPGARHITRLRTDLEHSKARCILLEPQIKPSYLASLTQGLDVRQNVVDPMGGDIELGMDAYASFMRNLASAFATCLQ